MDKIELAQTLAIECIKTKIPEILKTCSDDAHTKDTNEIVKQFVAYKDAFKKALDDVKIG